MQYTSNDTRNEIKPYFHAIMYLRMSIWKTENLLIQIL